MLAERETKHSAKVICFSERKLENFYLVVLQFEFNSFTNLFQKISDAVFVLTFQHSFKLRKIHHE